MIVWAGTSNRDVGLVVEHYPRVILPRRSQEIQVVPGRNGDIVLSNGSFENYEQPYQCFLDAKRYGGLEMVMPKLVDWLLGNEGYHKLEDSYFPNVYRMAYYSGGTEFISIFNEYGEGTLTFNCAPEKFYKSGDNNIILTNGQVIKNLSAFKSKPVIRITPTTDDVEIVNIYFEDMTQENPVKKTFTLQNFTYGTVGVDVKEHRVFHGNKNLNSSVTGNFEDLELGRETRISWAPANSVKEVNIMPRWWTI